MKYKVLKIVLAATVIASLAGCSDNKTDEQTTESTTEITTEITTDVEATTLSTTETTTAVTTQPITVAATQAATNAEVTVPKPTPTSKPTPAPAAGSLGVTYKGRKIMLNTNISAVSSALGNTTDYSEAPSCNYDGLDKIFTYGDVSIYTYPHQSGDLINEIEVNDASVAADKGINPIGMTMADVKAVYGEPTAVEGSTYKYANGNCYTYFYADGDMVSYWGVVYEG